MKRLNIVYLVASNALSGGLKVVLQQAEGLANRGHSVTIVSPHPAPDWSSSLHQSNWETAAFDQSNALAKADIRVATFWTTVGAALHGARGPVFHLCQGYEADFSFYAAQRRQIEQSYAKPTHKLTIAPHIENRLKAAGYGPVSYVGQTFDPDQFPPIQSRPFDRYPPRILLIGIFEADVKGIKEALSAIARLRGAGMQFTLHRVSPTPLSTAEQSIIAPETYDLRAPPKQMPEIYRHADILIAPSHPEEGFGLPVLEALSSGLPVLLSDTPGHRHIARESAEYFRCKDIDALSHTIKNLLRNQKRRAELSVRGPTEANRFHTERVVDRLLSLFEKGCTT